MIPELGLYSLILALLLCATSVVSALSFRRGLAYLSTLSLPTIYATSFFVFISIATLVLSFAQDDFSIAYVASNSNTNLPFIYKLCATWGGHEGSLLLWAFILTIWSVAFGMSSHFLPRDFRVATLSILGALIFGFILLIITSSSPFIRLLPFVPLEGADLNPLLQDPAFVIHPPILYMGYVGFAIPFALALSFLITRPKDCSWTQIAKPWVLLAWSFLTVGIILGSWWAYYELGWGGWWFWDPVENASLMPWLCGGAAIHAMLISKHREELESWSILLCLITFMLSLMGTFLVRSGVISSVHAFASDPKRGLYILFFLMLVIFSSFSLYFKFAHLKIEEKTDLMSKKSFLFLASLLLFVAMLSVLVGTLYPIFTEAFFDEKLSVGPPYFNTIMIPICILMLLTMAIGPFLHWQRTQKTDLIILAKKLFLPLIISVAILYFLPQTFYPVRWLGIFLGVFLLLFIVYKAYTLKNAFSLQALGMLLAHFGFGLSILSIVLVTTLETERELAMHIGETKTIHDYQFRFKNTDEIENDQTISKVGHFEISKSGKHIATLYPQKRYFKAREQALSETAIYPTLTKDFYIAMGELLPNNSWSVRIYIKPFIRGIWLGGLLIALGSLILAFRYFKKQGV